MIVDSTTLSEACSTIEKWARHRESRYVCVSNVHMCMQVSDDAKFCQAVNCADLTVPDGKPIAVALKMLGLTQAEHVRGADLTKSLCELAEVKNLTIGLYGGTHEAVHGFLTLLQKMHPNLTVGCAISPPFRNLSEDETHNYIREINDAQVQILFVGLGCPKQEYWMAQHRGKINAVMVGVGAVFDFFGGKKPEAPRWIQQIGLEWLFRMASEPKRLWKRYVLLNPRFLWRFGKQLISCKFLKAT